MASQIVNPEALQKAKALATEVHGRLLKSTTPRQRLWMGVALAIFVAVTAGLLWMSSRVEWRTLYTDLDPKDAQQAALELAAEKIPYQFDADGTQLRVPADVLDKARLGLAAKGLPQSGRLGFEIFDKPNWVGSEFDERVNYQRALEGELEHTIKSMGSIQSARVHLVLPHDSLFANAERSAKASVIIKLTRRSLSDTESDSIRTLVASAVDGLDPDHVTLVDADGRISFGPKNQQAETALYEQMLSERLIATLEPIAGKGNIRATVNVDYDTSTQEETQEMYDPKGTVMVSTQRSAQNAAGQTRATGIPGTASNAPNGGGATEGAGAAASTLPLFPGATNQGESAQQENSNFVASKRTRHILQGPGQVKRLTIAILVNDKLQTTGSGKQAVTKFIPHTAEEMQRMEGLAKTAVGFSVERGDQIAVEDLGFADNLVPTPPSTLSRLLPRQEQVTNATWLLAPVVLLLLLFFFVLRPVSRQLTQTPSVAQIEGGTVGVALPEPQSSDEAAAMAMARSGLPRPRNQMLSESISKRIFEDAAPAVNLIRTWINEPESPDASKVG